MVKASDGADSDKFALVYVDNCYRCSHGVLCYLDYLNMGHGGFDLDKDDSGTKTRAASIGVLGAVLSAIGKALSRKSPISVGTVCRTVHRPRQAQGTYTPPS